eukprot:TRINITY_DN5622_c0_g1_i1.p1 TRINITY_DN5622_c0_g1~~TRINITY_DN5622_c0_g1_i1.p1  ORF type:complete len:132 (-),score=39.84 TRINITY_DN5622_c0_g1_i1:332-727(-)
MAPKRRASLSQELPDEDDEPAGKPISKDGPALELDLSPKQNKLRTDLEMWVMDEVPALFGVDDSDELAEELQEDSQADRITELIAEKDAGAQRQALDAWLASCEDAAARGAFIDEVITRVAKVHEAGKAKR